MGSGPLTGQPPRLHEHPELGRIVDRVAQENPLQRKRIGAFLETQDAEYFGFAEALARVLNKRFFPAATQQAEAAAAYNRMCRQLVLEQLRFRKTGRYPCQNAERAWELVYSRPEVMRSYVTGLLLSYLFWPNHYRMLRLFKQHLPRTRVAKYLEIGVGHGLFTTETLRAHPEARATLVDLSPASIALAREMANVFDHDLSHVRFLEGDFLNMELTDGPYDLVVLGEVIEHVGDPSRFLRRARELLAIRGRIFLSTCANCPAVDHVYHFQSTREIRELIMTAGLYVIDELALPAEPVPEDRWEEEFVTINYAAMLTAGGGMDG